MVLKSSDELIELKFSDVRVMMGTAADLIAAQNVNGVDSVRFFNSIGNVSEDNNNFESSGQYCIGWLNK